MIASTQTTNTKIFALQLLKSGLLLKEIPNFTSKLLQNYCKIATFETRLR